MNPQRLLDTASDSDALNKTVDVPLEYPHPNPDFPAVPRPVPWLGFRGVAYFAVATIAVAGGTVALAALGQAISGYTLLLALFLLCATLLFLYRRIRAQSWRNGMVLPVIVLEPARVPKSSKVLLAIGLIPFMGLVASIFSRRVGETRNYVRGITYFHGAPQYVKWAVGQHFERYLYSGYAWIVVGAGGRCRALETVAPESFWRTRVSPQAQQWLGRVIQHAALLSLSSHDWKAVDREYRQAAKANSRALKKAFMYERRS